MPARLNWSSWRGVICGTAAGAAIVIATTLPAAAQGKPDARWQAWLGCWTPAGTLVRTIGRTAPSMVCVLPTDKASAVDILTISGGRILDRNHVDTDGARHTISRDACSGWQSARWSAGGRRVFVKSEVTCNGATPTHVSAIYAMAGSGEWLDVQGLSVDKNSGVRAIRYREAIDTDSLPTEVRQRLGEHTLGHMAAMLAATEAPSLSEIEEASHEVDANVVSTWLIETDKIMQQNPAPLNAKALVQLADNGVPGSVIDVMVGLSYPHEFVVNPVNYGQVARQGTDSAYGEGGMLAAGPESPRNPIIGFDRFGIPIYASESSLLYGCSPWLYGPYDAGFNLYSGQMGCSMYGYPGYFNSFYGGPYGGLYGGYLGYGYPYGYPYGGYYGGVPVVVPNNGGSTGTAPSHGRVVNGRGYSQGGNGSAGSAMPRSNSMSPSGGGAPSGGSPPPAPARTAVPRKP